jgi:hypothetical protein
MVLGAAAPAAAGDHEPIQHKRVHIQKITHDCEGEECDDVEHARRVIVVGTDGEAHELGGHAFKWVGRDSGHAFAMARPGKGGFLGVATTELTPELRRHFGVPEDAGVLVAKVVDDSAAARAGVEVGDVLTAVDGDEVASTGDLLHAVARLEPGSAVSLELWRDGRLETLGATLGERAAPASHAMIMHCGDNDGDCPEIAALGELGCGGDSPCKILIECKEAGCECTVNGETAECETLPGFEAPGE